MIRSLSKRRSGDGSGTDTVLSIDHPSLAPDGVEEQRSSTSPNTNEDARGSLSKYIVPPLSFISKQIEEIWYPFVLHAIASPLWCIGGCIILNIRLLAAGASVIPHLIMCLIWTISLPITLCSRVTMRKLSLCSRVIMRKLPLPSVFWKKSIFVISCIAVSLDPLFLYIPTIDEKNKCLDIDSKLMIVVLVLRSLPDLVFIFRSATRVGVLIDQVVDEDSPHYFDQILANILVPDVIDSLEYPDSDSSYVFDDRLTSDYLLDLLVILPVQQVVIIIGFFQLGSSRYQYTTTTVNILLVLHLISRACHIYYSHQQLRFVRNWTKAALNFFLYILAAHVLGAFWYFFSIQRQISCWHQVCKDITGCLTTYYCKDTTTSQSVTILKEFCPISSKNATGHDDEFNFGIYLDAFQYGTTGSINFPTKFLYTFWWGLRNLSNFGTNLQTSSYVWENLFTILIAVIGLLLFLYLIGNAQTYIQWASQKEIADAQEIILKTHNAIRSWMSKHLSSHEFWHGFIIDQIQEGKIVERKYATNMDMDVDVQFFFSCLDEFLKHMVKDLLCEQALKKVLWRRSFLFQFKVITDLEPVVYKKNSRVVRTNERIDPILFIVDGVIVASNEGANEGAASRVRKSRYEKGDFFGEEIFNSNDRSAHISDRCYICETKVEALALTYEKWIRILSNNQSEETVVVYSKSHLILLNKAYRKLTTTRWGLIEREIGLKMNLKRDHVYGGQKLREEIKISDILHWLSRNGFSDDVKRNIMTHIKGIVKQTIDDDVDIKYLLSHLPWDIQRTIRKQLGMKSLTKVPMLQNMDDSLLSIMCEKYLQPEIYSKENHLVRAEEAVGLMFIIIEGTVIAGSRRFVKGDFYGEPLLSWASPNNLFSSPAPISSEDVKCLTKVEVLELKANQFRSLVADFSSQWISNFNMCADSQQLDEDLAVPCGKINKKLNEPDEELAFPYDKIDKKLNETYKQLESKEVNQIEDEELRQKIKIMLKEKEILDWVSSFGISEDIMTQIKRIIKIKKVVEKERDADVNLVYVLSILPSNIKQSLKEHICISSLKKVPILENVDEDLLNRICLHLEPVIHPQNHNVIKTGGELDWMIIVVKGEIKCTATSNESTQPVTEFLGKGDLFGEEILASAFPSFFSLPTSNQNMMCQTKVEALVLTVDGLQSVLSYYKDKSYPVDKLWEELTSTTPLGLKGGMVAADTTSMDKKLDQILHEISKMGAFLAKFGYEGTPPPAT